LLYSSNRQNKSDSLDDQSTLLGGGIALLSRPIRRWQRLPSGKGASLISVPGLRCDGCSNYLLYQEEIVAVQIEDGRLLATGEQEGTRVDVRPAPIGRYHPDCYSAAREVDDRLPDARRETDLKSRSATEPRPQ
jgi:hypothetical protein